MSDLLHSRSSRRHLRSYVLTVFGAIFLYAPTLIDPARDCREYACPGWMIGLLMFMGVIALYGGIVTLARDWRWGSRLDAAAGELVWWDGPPPLEYHRIPLSTVHAIRVDSDQEVFLTDAQAQRIHLPADCLPLDVQGWARAVCERHPHIRLIIE